MTADLLIDNFSTLASAPGGIDALRGIVISLSIQGAFTSPRGNEESGHKLLKRISQERSRLIAKKKLRKPTKVNLHEAADGLLSPRSDMWASCRFGDIAYEVLTGPFGSSLHKSDYIDNGIPVINPASMKNGGIVPIPGMAISEMTRARLSGFILRDGDIVIARRGEMGRCAVVGAAEAGWLCGTGSLVLRLPPDLNRSFFVYLLRSSVLRTYLEGSSVGITMKNLNQKVLANAPALLPPIEEQSRVVERIKELLALCDELEAKQTQKRQARTRLNQACLDRLLTAQTPNEFAEHWQRIHDNFDLLYDSPSAVEGLSDAVLSLGVAGKLWIPSASDTPSNIASELRMYKETTRSQHKTRKLKPIAETKDWPHELPPNWRWFQLDDLIDPRFPISYGVLVPGPDTPGGVPLVRIGDLNVNNPAATPNKSIAQEVAAKFERTTLNGGEILLAVVGATIGKLGLAPLSWAGANIARAVCRIVPCPQIDTQFLLCVLQSRGLQSYFRDTTRTLAQPTLNVGLIRAAPIPVPSISTQIAIVESTRRLQAQAKELGILLKTKESASRHLLEALTHRLTQTVNTKQATTGTTATGPRLEVSL